MAGVWEKGQGRLRWVVVPPLRSIDASIEALNFAKEHGAVGLFFRGIERDRTLDYPYFFPVYQEAERLDMPVCVHTGAGCPAFTAIFDVTRSHTFPHTRTLPLMAFRNIVANKIPERFPELRFGFIEASAQWIPWVFKDIKRRAEGRKLPDNFFEAYRLYVSCYSSTDDIEYIAQYSTENVLMTGTDYGHVDMSVEIDALRSLSKSGKVRPELAKKILEDNPARFYGIQ